MTRQDDIAAARGRAHAVLGIYPGGMIYLGFDYADPGSLAALMVVVNEEIVRVCSIRPISSPLNKGIFMARKAPMFMVARRPAPTHTYFCAQDTERCPWENWEGASCPRHRDAIGYHHSDGTRCDGGNCGKAALPIGFSVGENIQP